MLSTDGESVFINVPGLGRVEIRDEVSEADGFADPTEYEGAPPTPPRALTRAWAPPDHAAQRAPPDHAAQRARVSGTATGYRSRPSPSSARRVSGGCRTPLTVPG